MALPNFRVTPARSMLGRAAPAVGAGPTAPQLLRRTLQAGELPNTAKPAGGLYPPGLDPSSFADQNAMANADVYQAGTFGAQNATANGTGGVLQADGRITGMPPAAAPAAPARSDPATTVRPVTGSPTDTMALNAGLYPAGAGFDGSRGRRGAAAPGLYPTGTGLDSALGVDSLRNAFAADRTFHTQIEPYIPTAGMAPEAAASRFGYLDKLALRSAGVPEAAPAPLVKPGADGWLRGQNAAQPIDLPGGGKGWMPPNDLPTGDDVNRSRVAQLAAQGRTLIQQQNQPQLLSLGKDSGGHPVEGVYQKRTGDFSRIKPEADFPRTIDAGGRKLTEVSSGKFTDDKGQPVEWKNDQEKPLNATEFLMSDSLYKRFDGDYSLYRDAHQKALSGMAGKGAVPAAPGAAPAAPSTANPDHNHNDVLAELRGRGLMK